MNRPTFVRISGLTLHGTVPQGEPFEGFALREFEGWSDAPSVRGDPIERPAQHGDFDTPITRGPRLVTASGWCRAYTPEKLRHFANQLTGLLADGQSGQLVVDEWAEAQHAQVRLYGDPRFSRRGSSGYADWSLKLRAVDPRKYGEVHDFPGGTVAVNRGNFPARPQLIVSGTAAAGYTVTGPGGRRVVVTKALTSGAPHAIDFAKGGLWVGGVRQLRAITIYQPWEIAPGLPGAIATVNNGASLIQRVTDTYV